MIRMYVGWAYTTIHNLPSEASVAELPMSEV